MLLTQQQEDLAQLKERLRLATLNRGTAAQNIKRHRINSMRVLKTNADIQAFPAFAHGHAVVAPVGVSLVVYALAADRVDAISFGRQGTAIIIEGSCESPSAPYLEEARIPKVAFLQWDVSTPKKQRAVTNTVKQFNRSSKWVAS